MQGVEIHTDDHFFFKFCPGELYGVDNNKNTLSLQPHVHEWERFFMM